MIGSLPKVSIIILTYNRSPDDVLECLKSVSSTSYPNLEVILVDNSTKCPSVFASMGLEDVRLVDVTGQENLGASGGRNIGIKHSTGEYLFFVDDDVIVDGNGLFELVKIAESDPSIGIIGPSMYRYDNPSEKWFYENYDQDPEKEVVAVPLVVGGALLAKREVIRRIGIFTLKAAKQVGKKGLVLAFEPERSNFRLLQLNVKINNLGNVKVFMVGLDEHNRWAHLYLDDRNTGGHSVCFQRGRKSCPIRLTTLDKMVERYAFGILDFLKIDVEGYELNVLKGAKRTLTKNSTKIAIASYHYINETGEIARYLHKLGYQTKVWFNAQHEPFIFATNTGNA